MAYSRFASLEPIDTASINLGSTFRTALAELSCPARALAALIAPSTAEREVSSCSFRLSDFSVSTRSLSSPAPSSTRISSSLDLSSSSASTNRFLSERACSGLPRLSNSRSLDLAASSSPSASLIAASFDSATIPNRSSSLCSAST